MAVTRHQRRMPSGAVSITRDRWPDPGAGPHGDPDDVLVQGERADQRREDPPLVAGGPRRRDRSRWPVRSSSELERTRQLADAGAGQLHAPGRSSVGPDPSARSSDGSPFTSSAQLPTHSPLVESSDAYAHHAGGPPGRSAEHAAGEAGGEQLDRGGRHDRLVGIHAPEHPAGLIGDRDSPVAGRSALGAMIPRVHALGEPRGVGLRREAVRRESGSRPSVPAARHGDGAMKEPRRFPARRGLRCRAGNVARDGLPVNPITPSNVRFYAAEADRISPRRQSPPGRPTKRKYRAQMRVAGHPVKEGLGAGSPASAATSPWRPGHGRSPSALHPAVSGREKGHPSRHARSGASGVGYGRYLSIVLAIVWSCMLLVPS